MSVRGGRPRPRARSETVALWASLIGLPLRKQVAILRAARIGEEEVWLMDDEASVVRAGTAHAEWPLDGVVRCAVCGVVDEADGVDLYWHPWPALASDAFRPIKVATRR